MSSAGQTRNTSETNRIWNIPNQITVSRLVLAIILFAIMAYHQHLIAMIVFLVAAGTDWVDGFLARRWGQVTVLGRMLDPFVDKIIICGVFTFLVAEPNSGVAAWMATVVVGRELLVTAIRSHMESRGVDFSASWAGKWKMAIQCLAAALCLFVLHLGSEAAGTWSVARDVSIWGAIVLTIYSGAEYIRAAMPQAAKP
jgi:CDP-diacylglycerol--glycerol-3-phosphate 3-phosphatidyltransferase